MQPEPVGLLLTAAEGSTASVIRCPKPQRALSTSLGTFGFGRLFSQGMEMSQPDC